MAVRTLGGHHAGRKIKEILDLVPPGKCPKYAIV
jgi:hypothetical protein